MTTHELKATPPYFEAVWDGRLTFQIRYNDRGYQTGDTVILRETVPFSKDYTGRTITARIGYMLASLPARGNRRGFNAGEYVVFSLVDIVTAEEPPKPLTGVITLNTDPAPTPAAIAAQIAGVRVSPGRRS